MELEDSPLQQTFRFLLIHIGNELQTRNCKALKFAHNLKMCKKEEDEEGLDILSELMQKGVFDAYHPEGLKIILEVIDRKDLANQIKKYQNSTIFKKEVKRRLAQRTREYFLPSLNLHDSEWTQGKEEKFMIAISKLSSHMSAMMEHTVALASSVETLASDETSRPQVLESISATKAKMEDLCEAIQEMTHEVDHASHSEAEKKYKRTLTEPTMRHLSVKPGHRQRSYSDTTAPQTEYLHTNSPTVRRAHRGQKAMMTLLSEFIPKTQRCESADSDSGSSVRNSNASFSSYEDEERYVSHVPGMIRRPSSPAHKNKTGSTHSLPSVYDDPDLVPEVRFYMKIPILSVEDTEYSMSNEETLTSQMFHDALNMPSDYDT